MSVKLKLINSLILAAEKELFVIALLAVSLVNNALFPKIYERTDSILQAISFNNGVTFIVALGLRKATAILSKQSRYFKLAPFTIKRSFFTSENKRATKELATSTTST